MRDNKALALAAITADNLAKRGMYPRNDAQLTVMIKTVNYYTRVMWGVVRDLYNGETDVTGFEDTMIALIEGQLRRAWNEGLREIGLDPARDMTPEMEAILDEIMVSELGYVDGLANDIIRASQLGQEVTQFRARVEMWANRYIDVKNRAMLFAGQNNLYKWELGETEKHCTDCAGYNGRIMTGKEWQQEKQPQARDLECGGWNCDCRLSLVVKS